MEENNIVYPYFIAVKLNGATKSYFFATDDDTYLVGDICIVETVRGLELGEIASSPSEMSEYHSNLALKPIVRRADESDINAQRENVELAKKAKKICQEEIGNFNLDMNLIQAEYTLDRTKIIFTYIANERVDFRDLLKSLAAKLKCRIELKQVGTRDKAKMIGGIGICGLPLCCSSFLNEFDGISINRAKNQLLSLNIPKLSGHCGKLICCLKYEDDTYAEVKKEFPKIGQRLNYNGAQYRIASMNVLTRMIKLEKPDDVQFVSLDDIKALLPKE